MVWRSPSSELVEHFLESRIALERFPARVHPERNQFGAAVLASFPQPMKPLVYLSRCEVD
jgi:hypothetical protein